MDCLLILNTNTMFKRLIRYFFNPNKVKINITSKLMSFVIKNLMFFNKIQKRRQKTQLKNTYLTSNLMIKGVIKRLFIFKKICL